MMYFSLIDRIIDLCAGEQLTAIKQLSPDEPFLHDHFPGFPVMPGVLMLEATYQASAWLLMVEGDFSTDMARLKSARQVKYGNFVHPGDVLTVTAEIVKRDENEFTLRTTGLVDGKSSITARLVLERGSSETNVRFPLRQNRLPS